MSCLIGSIKKDLVSIIKNGSNCHPSMHDVCLEACKIKVLKFD